jgi:hypothetical protein
MEQVRGFVWGKSPEFLDGTEDISEAGNGVVNTNNKNSPNKPLVVTPFADAHGAPQL